MNACIEMLNRWGDNFFSFAWPMLWQSSLLIAVVFAFDILLAKKIRASVRYALWMVVLVKLFLPPTLALPTGATWWLWRPKPLVEAPIAKNYTVTFDQTAPPANFVPQTISIQLPPPKLDGEAWTMLASVVAGICLLLWLGFRWMRVARKVRRATASDAFAEILEEARQLAGLRRPIHLKLINDTLSPAVYGLFRPVILLPLALMDKLSSQQLRAVLLHEAIHLRRGDVWVNCAQTLLQIVYWWHPLLWLANARIRRLREEAVDDAVMAALRDGADAYAPTLLEVAKFAFRRPLASLGLVGIMESRSALRQRIERLVEFRPPRKAGITFLSLCGIFVFSAVALPMGEGPEQTAQPAVVQKPKSEEPWPDPNFEGDRFVNLRAQFLILDASQLRETAPQLAENGGPTLLPAEKSGELLARLKQSGARCFCKGWESGILQSPLSGGYQFYRIGGSTDGTSATTALTTNWGGSFSNMLYGYDIQTPATQPDWTPMNLTLRALMQDGSTLCQMDLSFPNTGNHSRHSDMILPNDYALVWCANPPNAPGKYQVIVLSPFSSEQEIHERIQDGKLLFEIGKFDDAKLELNNALKLDPGNEEAHYYLKLIQDTEAGKAPITRVYKLEKAIPDENLKKLLLEAGVKSPPTVSTYSWGSLLVMGTPDQQALVERVVRKLNGFSSNDIKATNDDLNKTSQARATVYKKLNNIRMDTVSYQSLPLSEVIRQVHELSKLRDPDKKGINFLFNPNPPQSTINPATGLPENAAADSQPFDPTQINITLNLNNVGLLDLLNAICLVADHPIKYSVEAYGVVFSGGTNASACEMRTFKVDPKTFYSNLKKVLPPVYDKDFERLIAHAVAQGVVNNDSVHYVVHPSLEQSEEQDGVNFMKQFFSALNVNLDPPKTVFFNDRLGVLFVYATPQDLDVIERAVQLLNQAPPKYIPAAPVSLNNVISDPLTATLPVSSPVSSYVDPTNLIKRTFPVDYNGFITAVRKKTGEENLGAGFKELAADAGVDLSPPKTFFVSASSGLCVYAEPQDMKALRHVVDDLHCPPPQIHIKARFFEIPESFFANAHAGSLAFGLTNGVALTAAQAKDFLHELQSLKDIEELAEPEATTLPLRQTQMRALTIQPVVTNYVLETSANNKIIPQVDQIETGPVLDVIPIILYGDYKIYLQTTASLIEFLGYADTKNLPPHYATNSIGEKVALPIVLPKFQVKEASLNATLYDSQTLVLFPQPKDGVAMSLDDEKWRELVFGKKEKQTEKRTLIVLVTATLIDAAGNRLHSDDEMRIPENTNYFDTVPISANVP